MTTLYSLCYFFLSLVVLRISGECATVPLLISLSSSFRMPPPPSVVRWKALRGKAGRRGCAGRPAGTRMEVVSGTRPPAAAAHVTD